MANDRQSRHHRPRQTRRVLVTGASSGIGTALVREIAARGDVVLCTGRRAAAALPADFPDVAYLQADLARAEGRAALLSWADGPLDCAILNAGAGHYRPISAEDDADIDAVIATNLVAPVMLAHGLFSALSTGQGRLALVGSVAFRGAAGMPVYAASKAALDGFGRALASEWRGRVTVRVLHPGPTATGMAARAGRPADWVERIMLPPGAVARTMLRQLERGSGGYRSVVSYPQVALHALMHSRRQRR